MIVIALAVGIFAGSLCAMQKKGAKYIDEIANRADTDVNIELVYPEIKPLIEVYAPKKEALKPVSIIILKKHEFHKFTEPYEVIPSMGDAIIRISFADGTKSQDIDWTRLKEHSALEIKSSKEVKVRGPFYKEEEK